MTVRGIKWVLVLKCTWLAANLAIWLMGLGSCLTEPHCSLANDGLLPLLYLLSFPGSILFLIFNGVVIDSGVFIDASPPLHYSFLSLGTLAVGYIQWFHVLPALFGKQGITVLSLNQPMTSSAVEQEPRKRSQPVQVQAAHIPALDKTGRTPLERVINRKPRRQLTDSS